MENRLIRIIYNPIAGKGKALKLLPEVKRHLQDLGLPYHLDLTEGVGHAIKLAEASCSGEYDTLVAAGGDGTMNEVLNGMMKAKERVSTLPKLAVLCVGRGNDFAYGADIPTDLQIGLELIKEGRTREMDAGRITGGDYPSGRYFGNGIGIGFDTIVGLEAAKMNIHGFMAYVVGALKTLITYPEPPQISINFNDKSQELQSPQISIMNGRRMGGTFFMAPEAYNNDGLLDLCMADKMKRGELVSVMLQYTKGTQATNPHITMDRAVSYEITAPEGGLVCHADGETICIDGKRLFVEALPRQVVVVCDPSLRKPVNEKSGKDR